ncbi:hypothetical protein RAZWK3B_15418 [Roseobacter sp. AzwK-3b]|uniref:hypothetical protein n=1 Tax=Roseobacter sp. AzwK-3b TaxID=351016 RepID=UPI000156A3BD|nr:hypothetical protein [Roseobacter sp. AzwK-3b]EDM70799.1 hypothetical protein RAZWK3B_15418 [Roseobacter sp. AzwK-3b]
MTDLIDRAKSALEGATPGRRVQFHGDYYMEAKGTPFTEWDTSHDTSVILPNGERLRGYSRHKHAADAELDNLAPDLARLAVAAAELADRLDAKLRLCCGGTDADRAAIARFRAIAEGKE